MYRRLLVIIAALALISMATPASAVVLATDQDDNHDGFSNYVALGDSYTAAPLVPAPTTGPLGCVRSSADYPAYLASYFNVNKFSDVSCSAARSKHMFESQSEILPRPLPESDNKPQLLALTKDTDLVTLGIGGNDFGLFGEMISQCETAADEHPDAETPCKDRFTQDGVDTKIRDAKKIQGHVEEVLAGIHERAPKATVVVVNYLHILPETDSCSDIPFADGDYRWGTKVHHQLNDSLRRASARFGDEYADMYAASKGHDACSDDPWVNGADIKPHAMSFHPFRQGMRAIAHTIYQQLAGEEAPAAMPEFSLVKRLPEVVDVSGIVGWLTHAGDPPAESIERPSDDAYPGAQ